MKMITNVSPQMRRVGCVALLGYVGAFAAGIYRGANEAKGIMIDPQTANFIRYGPVGFNTLLGIAASRVASNDGTLEEMADNMSDYMDYDQAETMSKGCSPVLMPAIYGGVTFGIEYLGYLVGGWAANL